MSKSIKLCELKHSYANENLKILEDKNILRLRNDFDIFKQDIVYLDNSATTQKPNQVIEQINEYYLKYCSNTNRSIYKLDIISTNKIKDTRKIVSKFLNVEEGEIIFTSGATESSNLLAYSYGLNNLKSEDEILFCDFDHKSTVLPWINISNILKKFNVNVKLKSFLIDSEGDYNEQDIKSKVNDSTKVVILTHIHSVYGLEMNIQEIVNIIRQKNKNCKIVLDCSQSVGHIKVDLKKLDIDFAYFSAHKMFASCGVGVCYVKRINFKLMNPFMLGGGFSQDIIDYNDIYKLFESGTSNIPGILSLGKAIEYIENIGIDLIENYILELTRYCYEKLKAITKIEFIKGIDKCSCKLGYGIISFRIESLNSNEIGEILSDYGIYVRTGRLCNYNEKEDYIRVSLHIYNNKSDIDKLVKILWEILKESNI